MNLTRFNHRCAGFSLIEVLTVLVIIGLIASIVVPNLGLLTGAADTATNRRNAQTILLAYTTGAATGVEWPEGDVATQVAAVIAGKRPPQGIFSSRDFRATLPPEVVPGTYPFIPNAAFE